MIKWILSDGSFSVHSIKWMTLVKWWSLGQGRATRKVISVYYILRIAQKHGRAALYELLYWQNHLSIPRRITILIRLTLPFLALCPLLFIACVHTGNVVCSGVYRLVNRWCMGVIYWAGEDGKHGRVQSLELRVGIKPGVGMRQPRVCSHHVHARSCYENTLLQKIAAKHQKQLVFFHIDLNVRGATWTWWGRIEKKQQKNNTCFVVWGRWEVKHWYAVHRCSRWHVGGSRWRRRESVCGQSSKILLQYICASGWLNALRRLATGRERERWRRVLLLPLTHWHLLTHFFHISLPLLCSSLHDEMRAAKTRWALITRDLEL